LRLQGPSPACAGALEEMRTLPRPDSRLLALVVVVATVLSALALASRWSHTSAIPFDFAPARQFQGAQIAQTYYIEMSDIAYGNVLTAIAFLAGLAHEELTTEELKAPDGRFSMLVRVTAVNR
jgi:hypothetical protein